MEKNNLKNLISSKWFLLIFFASAYPIVNFVNVNKMQLLPIHFYKLSFYFIVIFLFALLFAVIIKKIILKSIKIEQIAFSISLAILVFFGYTHDHYILSFLCLLIIPILGLLFSKYKVLSNWFFFVIILALTLSSIQIIWSKIQSIDFTKSNIKKRDISENFGQDFVRAKNPPNVYYFVPDCYMRSDRVKKVLNYDNQPFLDKLSELGFYIADKSYSNYPTTFLSLSSLLAMDYVATEDMKPFTNKEKFFEILSGKNATVNRFKKHGYQFARMGPGRWDPGRCTGNEDICLNKKSGFSELDYMFWGSTPVLAVVRKLNLVTTNPKSTFTDIKQSLENLKIDDPLFVFGHILMPHPPYIFDKECNLISAKNLNQGVGTGGWWGEKAEKFYLGELRCVNKQIAKLVEYITNNDPESIIVIQADTGTHFGYEGDVDIMDKPLSKWSKRDLEENYANLTAIKVPKKYYKWLYPSISQVNTFRLLFSMIENKKLPLINDYSYSTHYENKPGFGKVYKYQ